MFFFLSIEGGFLMDFSGIKSSPKSNCKNIK